MKITNTILTKMAEVQSEHAAYTLEYNITNGLLERIQATMYRLRDTEERDAVIGSIYYDRGSVTVNMPFCKEMPRYVADFCGYVDNILGETVKDVQVLSELSTN